MMRILLLTAASLLLTLSGWSQGFKNPVLPGFHADPSVCRAGDDSSGGGSNNNGGENEDGE